MHNKIHTLKLGGAASCYVWPVWNTAVDFFPKHTHLFSSLLYTL